MSIARYLSKFAALLGSDGKVPAIGLADAAVTQAKLAANLAGNGPAFYAYASAATAMSANAQTKVNFQSEMFDSNSNFDTTTGRFQPTTAGYYWIASTVRYDVANNLVLHTYINHNRLGTVGTGGFLPVTASQGASHASTLAYFNGTSDYVEVAAYVHQAGNTYTGQGNTYFTGFLARAA